MTRVEESAAGTPHGRTAAHALAALRAAIVDGRIPQGEQLRELPIAALLGVGRSAVREAIRQLVQEGLAEHAPHRGAFVRVLDADAARDLYLAREAVEAGVARQVVAAPAPPDVAGLADAFAELRAAAVGDHAPSERLVRADVRFHRELVRLGGSARLARAYDTLAAETTMLLRHHPPYPAEGYVASHRLVVEALERRDPAAPDLVADHLRTSASILSVALAEDRW